MKNFALFSVSATIFVLVNPAVAQYGLWPRGVWLHPIPPGYMIPSYRWRERRLYEDWRRGYIVDPRQVQESFEPPPILNNTGRRAVTDPGECAIGFSEETCRRRGQKYNPPSN